MNTTELREVIVLSIDLVETMTSEARHLPAMGLQSVDPTHKLADGPQRAWIASIQVARRSSWYREGLARQSEQQTLG
jgi:hypothetical protein